jgi:hypothetical protein
MYVSSFFPVHFLETFRPKVLEISASVDDSTSLTHNGTTWYYRISWNVYDSTANVSQMGVVVHNVVSLR